MTGAAVVPVGRSFNSGGAHPPQEAKPAEAVCSHSCPHSLGKRHPAAREPTLLLLGFFTEKDVSVMVLPSCSHPPQRWRLACPAGPGLLPHSLGSPAPQAVPTRPALVLSPELTPKPESQRPAPAPAPEGLRLWCPGRWCRWSVQLSRLCPPLSFALPGSAAVLFSEALRFSLCLGCSPRVWIPFLFRFSFLSFFSFLFLFAL